jgi:chemotaxis protein CheC
MIEAESTKKNLNVVIIRVKNEKYLVQVNKVKEIFIPGENIVPIPLADKTIVGVIDIRGDLYSILSLRRKIYTAENIYEMDKDTRILLLERNGLNLGILVDEVIGVREVPMSIFNETNKIVETDLDFEFINAIGILNGNTYILLNLDAFIRSFNINENYRREKAEKPKQQGEVKEPATLKPEKKAIFKKDQEEIISTFEDTYDIIDKPENVDKKINLNDEQEDMLKEIGNIGSGNAITALSRLIKKKINVDLTNVGIISFENLAAQFGGPNQKVCGIFSQIEGTSQSTIFQAFELTPLMKMVKSIAGEDSDIDPDKVKSKEDIDEYARSTITEMGNILAGHYASALADLTDTKMMTGVPEFTVSDVDSLGRFLGKELESIYTFIVVIKTSIQVVDYELNGVFLFIPDLDTLYNLFENLGISYEPLMKGEKGAGRGAKSLALSERQKDALREVGNIGSGNAANALAKMINKKVTIDIPAVEMVELDKYSEKVIQKNEKLYTSWSNVKGKTRATVLTIFEVRDIIELTAILVDDEKKKQVDLRKRYDTISDFPDTYQSAMEELGNILASNYVTALGDLLDIRFMTEPPDVLIENAEKLFNLLKQEIGFLKKLSLVITTNVIITDIEIQGTFILIPQIETLHELLNALDEFYQ